MTREERNRLIDELIVIVPTQERRLHKTASSESHLNCTEKKKYKHYQLHYYNFISILSTEQVFGQCYPAEGIEKFGID